MKKQCKECKKKKSLKKFYASNLYKDGHEAICIDCRKLMRTRNERRICEERKLLPVLKSKICRICEVEQDITNFSIASDRKDGYRSECKSCQKDRHRQWVLKVQKDREHLKNLKSKVCHDCGKRKRINMFAKNSHNKDGYGTQCRLCRKEYHQTLLDKDPNYDKKRNARRRLKPEVRADNKRRNRKWREENVEQHRENNRLWREKEGNKERALERQRKWAKTDSGKRSIRVSHMNRRNHRKLGKLIIQQIEDENRFKYGSLTCEYCKQPIEGVNYHMDHKIPITREGENIKENLWIACATCNLSKRTMTSDEFIKSDRLKKILKIIKLRRSA